MRVPFMPQLAIVAIAVVLPIYVIANMQLGDVNRAISAARGERIGVTCVGLGYGIMRQAIALTESTRLGDLRALRASFRSYARSDCPRTTDFAALLQKLPVDRKAITSIALDVDHLINNAGDTAGLTFESDPAVTDAADGTDYALVDALPALISAGTSLDAIDIAKSEATAASRLSMLNSDIDGLLHAAPQYGHELLQLQDRMNVTVARHFFKLDQWERLPKMSHTGVLHTMPASFAALDVLSRTLLNVVDELLAAKSVQLQRKRTVIITTAIVVLAFALLIICLVARNIILGHRRELRHFKEMSHKEARFKAIFVGSPQPIAITDAKGNVVECNQAYCELVGSPLQPREGTPLFAPLRSNAPLAIKQLFEPIGREPSESANREFTLFRSDDSELCCVATATSIYAQTSEMLFYAVMLSDVTERQHNERRLQHEATQDKLTNIANRAYLVNRIEQSLKEPQDAPRFALLFIDVDDFKTVNDTLGHLAGDACLQAIAQRLRSHTRPDDVVARYGGDEFAILLCDRMSIQMVDEITSRLHWELKAPIEFARNVLVVSSSIGVAVDTGSFAGPEAVLEAADRAMYVDKDSKRNRSVSIQRLRAYSEA